ncbi:6-phosphogluconolactonase [compost metagenome]
MPRRQTGGQRRIDQGPNVRRAGDELGFQYLALLHLRSHIKQWPCEHIGQPRQPVSQLCARHLEKIVCGMRLGAGVQTPATRLHPGHQPLAIREALAAPKQEVLKKVREPRVLPRLVMTSRGHSHQCRSARGKRVRHQGHAQAVGQQDLARPNGGLCSILHEFSLGFAHHSAMGKFLLADAVNPAFPGSIHSTSTYMEHGGSPAPRLMQRICAADDIIRIDSIPVTDNKTMIRTARSLLLAGGIGLLALTASAADHHLLVGTYTDSKSEGIYHYRFDSATGRIESTPLQMIRSENPSWLTFSRDLKYLFVVNENGPGGKDEVGKVSSFRIDPKTRDLRLINQVESRGDHPTHVSLAKDEQHLFIANYAATRAPGGSLAVVEVDGSGRLSTVVQQEVHGASGVDPDRQSSSHVHSAVSSPDGHYVYVQDLGADKIFVYRYDPTNMRHPLVAAVPAAIELPPGSGPRHLLFSPDGRHAYLTLEMSAQIAVFDREGSNLTLKQLTDMAAGQAADHKSGAALHLCADGRFLYASNRGKANELLVYAVDKANGKLKELQRRPVEGVEPREFSLDPTGRFVLIANQKSNQIVVVRREPSTGLLGETVQKFAIDSPSDVKFLHH